MEENQTYSAVFYTDGGAHPNPGWAGSGVHGYIYSHDTPKKGLGLGSIVATANGYRDKAGKKTPPKEVTVIKYFDIYKTVAGEMRTNNMGELVGLIAAMKHCTTLNLDSVTFWLDSEYVLKGITDYVHKWQRFNWVRPDGSPIKNKEYWLELLEARNELMARGVSLSYDWTKGHVENLESIGNNKADKLATAGRLMAKKLKGLPFESSETSDPQGYWKDVCERDPLFYLRWCYYTTQKDRLQRGVYFLGNQSPKDDSGFGVRTGDGAFGVVCLQEPSPGLEEIRESLCNPEGEFERTAAVNIDTFFNGSFQSDWQSYGMIAYERTHDEHANAKTLTGQLLSAEFDPPAHSVRAVNSLESLYRILAGLEESDFGSRTGCKVTDITEIFFERKEVEKKVPGSKEKVKEEELVLKESFGTGFATLKCQAPYDLETCPKGSGEASITLTLGVDMPDRNALKRLEKDKGQLYLICVTESDESFRYYVAVRSARASALFGAIYSNIRFII